MKVKWFILAFLWCNGFFIFAQHALLPMDIPPFLSANFAELRNNHFHAGIDLKTQGRTGIPVKVVKEGYVARISVSPSGYGRAVYLNHLDGTTTVYGHLHTFSASLEEYVANQQYLTETFKVDISLLPEQFPLKQGEIIGLSGNTGSSGGPHLHFEVRNTQTEEPQDPLVLFQDKIKDNIKPSILSFMVYPKEQEGVVNGKSQKQKLSFVKTNKQSKELSPSKVLVWGKVGFAVRAYDYANQSHNQLGVKEIRLRIDDKLVFHSKIERFSFEEGRYINSFIDWEEWIYHKAFYMKSFIEPGNRLRIYQTAGDGYFLFNEEREYSIHYELKDLYGNTAEYSFTVTGAEQAIDTTKTEGVLFPYQVKNYFMQDGLSLILPENSLYKSYYLQYSKTETKGSFPTYHLLPRIPLHKSGSLSLPLPQPIGIATEKYGIVQKIGNTGRWIGGEYQLGLLTAKIRELGAFTVEVDTLAPTIVPINKLNWSTSNTLSFRVGDKLSGIAGWKGYIDHQFVLFELDAKTGRLFCKYDEKRMKRGKVLLQLEVTDYCNNTQVYEEIINW